MWSATGAERPARPGSSGAAEEKVHPVAAAELPTRFGDFRVVAFTGDPHGKEHIALVRGDVRGASHVGVRVHSECLTGEVLGSLRCECRDQLIASLKAIGNLPRGVVASVELMTNNPAKIRGLLEHGIRVVARIPVVTRPNRHNAAYLATKRRRAGHWLSRISADAVRLDGASG